MNDRTYKLKAFVNLEGGEHDQEGVMVDTHSATMCSCNPTAWVLVKALNKKASVAHLVGELVAAFDVTEPAARRDVMNFIHQLGSMGLIDENE